MTYKRKKYHHGDTHLKRRWRVRNRKKDLDEIDSDLKEGMYVCLFSIQHINVLTWYRHGYNIEVICIYILLEVVKYY